jgi:hypothetical protein
MSQTIPFGRSATNVDANPYAAPQTPLSREVQLDGMAPELAARLVSLARMKRLADRTLIYFNLLVIALVALALCYLWFGTTIWPEQERIAIAVLAFAGVGWIVLGHLLLVGFAMVLRSLMSGPGASILIGLSILHPIFSLGAYISTTARVSAHLAGYGLRMGETSLEPLVTELAPRRKTH